MKKNSHGRNKKRIPLPIMATAVLVAVVVLIQFFVPRLFSAVAVEIAQPAWQAGAVVEGWFKSTTVALREKQELAKRNAELQEQVARLERKLAANSAITAEYKELTNLPEQEETMRARVLAAPGMSPYDTLILNAGREDGITVGDRVLGRGGTVMGDITSVQSDSATATLFSAPGRKTEVRLGKQGVPVTVEGHGGGSFYVQVPHDLSVETGGVASLPDSPFSVIAVVADIERDTAAALQDIYLQLPVNINEIRWVLVETHEE